jgi:hypothetical protein
VRFAGDTNWQRPCYQGRDAFGSLVLVWGSGFCTAYMSKEATIYFKPFWRVNLLMELIDYVA